MNTAEASQSTYRNLQESQRNHAHKRTGSPITTGCPQSHNEHATGSQSQLETCMEPKAWTLVGGRKPVRTGGPHGSETHAHERTGSPIIKGYPLSHDEHGTGSQSQLEARTELEAYGLVGGT